MASRRPGGTGNSRCCRQGLSLAKLLDVLDEQCSPGPQVVGSRGAWTRTYQALKQCLPFTQWRSKILYNQSYALFVYLSDLWSPLPCYNQSDLMQSFRYLVLLSLWGCSSSSQFCLFAIWNMANVRAAVRASDLGQRALVHKSFSDNNQEDQHLKNQS